MKKIISIMTVLVLCIGAVGAYANTNAEQVKEIPDEDSITVAVEGRTLQKDVDYTLTYRDNIKPGTATVMVDFIGNYSGTMEQTFEIVRKKHTSSGSGYVGWGSTADSENPVTGDTVIDQDTEYDPPYIIGYEDNTFHSDAAITRAETATAVLRAANDVDHIAEEAQAAPAFSDIGAHWARGYINAAADKGIVNGYGDGTYLPDSFITRAEFSKIIAKMLGGTAQNSSTEFTDISEHWAKPYIVYLAEQGIINGYLDGTFRPDAPITRAEAVTIINRAIPRKISPTVNAKFVDVPSSHWAYSDIIKAAGKETEK